MKDSKEKDIKVLKDSNRELELRLNQLIAEDLQEEVPLLAQLATTSEVPSNQEGNPLNIQRPEENVWSLNHIRQQLCHWNGVDSLIERVIKVEKETEGL